MTERLCASGHVVEVGRDTCSRCNGPVLQEEVVETLPAQEESNMVNEEEKKEEGTQEGASESENTSTESTEGGADESPKKEGENAGQASAE